MARRPSVRYWASRKGGGYFCTINGRLHELALGPDDATTGPTYLAALARFREILELGNVHNAGSQNTVRVVLETYTQHIAGKRQSETLEIRLRSYKPFVAYRPEPGDLPHGEKTVGSLTHFDVYRFLDAMAKPAKRGLQQEARKPVSWGPGSQRNCIQSLNAAFNWATRTGLITKNPLAGIEMPRAASMGEDALVGKNAEEIEANHKRILASAPAWLQPFVQALKDTGARPGEIAAASAADFDSRAGGFVFRKATRARSEKFQHKTAGKGKERIIFLSGQTLETVKQLAKQHPSGPLFRVSRTGGAVRKKTLAQAFRRLQHALGMPHLTAYSYRHTFATEMRKAGMDVETLAELMGNSAAVIRHHYSHLLADRDGLRSKLERFRALTEGTQSRPESADVLPFASGQ